MTQNKTLHSQPALRDWHSEDIKAALRKNGYSLAQLADYRGVTRQSMGQALVHPREAAEVAIASVIGVDPFVIWPSRYAAEGVRLKPQPRRNYGLPPRRIREAKRTTLNRDLAATAHEPLDPISPLPNVPPAQDAAATEVTRLFVQRGIGIIMDGNRYWHPMLAAYVGQYVDTRYDRANDALIVLSEDGAPICTAGSFMLLGYDPATYTLPPPSAQWMGDLHRAFSASPADTANAALRKRVAELEAALASSAPTDAYYNGGISHADQMAANEAAYLSQRTAQLDRLNRAIDRVGDRSTFIDEMAAWPPVYEAPTPGRLRRFVNCLNAVAASFRTVGAASKGGAA